jgi:hypothetical protein
MNETTKTLTFVGAAAGLLAIAIFMRPAPLGLSKTDDSGQPFFPDFKDPLQAKSLEVIEFDEDQAALKPFKVAQVRGIWSIPSHENYPADAQHQLALAASSLIDLKKLAYVSDKKADQEVYGVVDPTSKDLTAASTGVGKKVTMEDGDGKVLAQFIIGKADPQRSGVRFVRIPSQERIYRTEISVDKLSTNFGDWIEKDLLKMNAFDVKQVIINDHRVDEINRTLDQRSLMTVGYDNQGAKWTPIELKEFVPRSGWKDTPLKDDEELNSTKLNDLKTALDDLKIIDVARKPEGLSRDLRVDPDAIKDPRNLMAHGFFPAKVGNNQVELYSNEGEVRAGMNDGVEYVVRFGEIAGNEKDKTKDDAKKSDDKKDDSKKDDKSDDAGASRYVMVTARFNRDLVPAPKLQPLPDSPAEAGDKPAANAPVQNPFNTDAPKTETPKPESPKPAAPTVEAPKTEPAKTEAPKAATPAPSAQPATPPAAESAPPAETKPKSSSCDAAETENSSDTPNQDVQQPEETPKAEAPKTEAPKTEAPKVDVKPADTKTPEARPADKPKTEAELERERIEKENKRLVDEYSDKLKAGEKRVKELNDRFADWYFVISEATYKKIHLTRDDIVQKKPTEKAAAEKPEADKAGADKPGAEK